MKMIDKALKKLRNPFAIASIALASANCAAIPQRVCHPVQGPPTVVYDRWGRRMIIPGAVLTDPSGRPYVQCETVYSIVPKALVQTPQQ
jgi:hypothetical protein